MKPSKLFKLSFAVIIVCLVGYMDYIGVRSQLAHDQEITPLKGIFINISFALTLFVMFLCMSWFFTEGLPNLFKRADKEWEEKQDKE